MGIQADSVDWDRQLEILVAIWRAQVKVIISNDLSETVNTKVVVEHNYNIELIRIAAYPIGKIISERHCQWILSWRTNFIGKTRRRGRRHGDLRVTPMAAVPSHWSLGAALRILTQIQEEANNILQVRYLNGGLNEFHWHIWKQLLKLYNSIVCCIDLHPTSHDWE